MINVFDLDGCIIDSLHRYRTKPCGTKIDLDYWRKNCTPEKIMQDTLLPLANYYKKLVKDVSETVLIATARVMQDADFQFLKKYLDGSDAIIHRLNDNDTRRGFDLKCEGILSYINEFSIESGDIVIYDDNLEQLKNMQNILSSQGYFVDIKYIPSKQGH